MLEFIVLSSHDATCDGRRSLLSRSDLSSALEVYENAQSQTCIDRMNTDD